jgi:hypothetical protein
MPTTDSFAARSIRHIAAILSVFTLLTLAGCGSDSDGVQEDPAPITDSNGIPRISGTPPTSVLQNEPYTFTPSALDPNGDRLTFEIQNQPSWASFDTATGRLSGTPTGANVGAYANVIITVTDGRNRVSLPAFTIAVNAIAIGQATLSWTPPTLRSDGAPLDNLAGYRIYYGNTPDSTSNVIAVPTAGVTTYVVENLGAGTWYFAVSAVDSAGMESVRSNQASKTIS